MTSEYEVIDPYGITYRPTGGEPMTVQKGEIISDLTPSAARWLEDNGAVRLKSEADLTKLNREDLNEAAVAAGIADPAGLPNRDAVIQAITTMKETPDA